MSGCRDQRGQALLLLVGALAAVLIGAFVLGAVARGVGVQGRDQRAADLGALAGARTMRGQYERLFEPPTIGGRINPRHLERADYLALGRASALQAARHNGARDVAVEFPDANTIGPVRIAVTARDPAEIDVRGGRRRVALRARAEAELVPPGDGGLAGFASGSGYRGPLVYRQGKPMRPDTALAFDRMNAAARAAGVSLIVVSAYRSDAEQAKLFAQNPDPKWVAPPGQSLHRLGTELDLGPAGAWGWLEANAGRFNFHKRYSWEPWHFGYALNPGSTSVGFGYGGGERRSTLPSFVPARFIPALSRAAQRWSVSAALLAAQLYAESNFNPFSVSSAGAQGIAQFTPGTAAAYGLRNPFDATASIDAQAHLMHDLLRRFGSVPLALAAYNAGEGAVAGCGCIPPYAETRGYVARILALLRGAGDSTGLTDNGLKVRLVK
jgi:transglycosylase-like protein with SLT domain/D-alanyl-D-alanine carboxypeptidase-like protein